jgi:hypothetical protein
MITLHGFAFSNYYNIVKHVLMHKEIPFEEDLQFGGSDDYLEISPVGKVPSMTMADIYLRYVLKVVNIAGAAKLEWDIVGEIDGLAGWDAMMAESAISQKIDADQEANAPLFFNHISERFGL